MSKAAVSVKVFGVYLVGLGLVLLTVPNLLLAAFAIPATDEVWIRVMGVLIINMGANYWHAAITGARAHLMATVFARLFVFVSFTAFAVLRLTTIGIIPFGAVDLAGAVWTWVELRREAGRAGRVTPATPAR